MLDTERTILNRQERKGQLAEGEADTERAAIDRQAARLEEVKMRAAAELRKGQVRDFTIESLLGTDIGFDLAHPGTEREAFTDEETGLEVLEVPDWTDVAKWLNVEAQKVLSGEARTLALKAIEWAARLVEVFDITVKVYDVDADSPRVVAEGTIDLGVLQIGAATENFRATIRRANRKDEVSPLLGTEWRG